MDAVDEEGVSKVDLVTAKGKGSKSSSPGGASDKRLDVSTP